MVRLEIEAAKLCRGLAIPILALTVWFLASNLRLVNPLFLPPLSSVSRSAASLLSVPSTYLDIGATVSRAFWGLLISIGIAVPAGLVLGRIPKIYDFFELGIDFFRSVPSSSLFFLFLLIFGIGDASKIAIVVYGCSLVILVNTIYGARPLGERADRLKMMKSFGASRMQILWLCVLPDALPSILAGIRVSLSLAFVLVVVTEMFLTSTHGLGRRIYDSYLAYEVSEMYVLIIVLGLVGFLSNKLALALERRFAFWVGADADVEDTNF